MLAEEPENPKYIAHIVDGKVVNVSIWDGISPWEPDEKTVEIPVDVPVGIDWDYSRGKFKDNRPVEVDPNADKV